MLGHSLGVNIILDLYRIAPERVSALVLANGTPKDPFETMFHHNFLQIALPFIYKARDLFPNALQKFWASQGENPVNQFFISLTGFNPKYAKREDINEYLRITSLVNLDVFLFLLGDFMNYDATPWLHEVKAPTLVIMGERDLITPPKNQKVMAKLIPHSELCVIAEGSHCSQMDKPDLVNGILNEFLANTRRVMKPVKAKKTTATKKPARSSRRAET